MKFGTIVNEGPERVGGRRVIFVSGDHPEATDWLTICPIIHAPI
jgi:hypothetical protein